AGGVYADLGDAPHARRSLHALGRSLSLRSYPGEDGSVVSTPRGMGPESHPECWLLRKVFKRPHHRRIRRRHLAGEALSGGVDSPRSAMRHHHRYIPSNTVADDLCATALNPTASFNSLPNVLVRKSAVTARSCLT